MSITKPEMAERIREKELFDQARQYLKPTATSRLIAFLYAERKLMVFFLVHFVCTLIIWGHFFLTKWQEQEVAVPAAAPHRMLKRLVPSLEFGAMHAILFQMALIPLSMSRFSIAALSESIVDRFVPLNRAVRIHIHLGYTMVTVVVVATLLFFGFFGAMCIDGEQAFCDKFRSEIMITGYCIFAFMLIIVGTSYFRHKIPYELFYAIHHLVFLIYITTIVHTFDNVQRKGQRSRSQTFVWFSATLIYYLCDRAAMYVSHRYQARLISSSTVSASNGSRMVVLRLRRPVLFNFKPGQYAYLRLDCIDGHWHPFSIASGPDSSTIEFYIEVCGESSWTGQLWALLDKERGGVTKSDMSTSKKQMWFEVMGPYGSSLGARPGSYSHVLAIGAGTGIVPILSLFRQHVEQLLRLDPNRHFAALGQAVQKAVQIEIAEGPRKGSLAEKAVSALRRRRNRDDMTHSYHYDNAIHSVRSRIAKHSALKSSELTNSRTVRRSKKTMQRAAFQASRSIKGTVLLSFFPVIGVALIGLTISWNTVKFDVTQPMVCTLKYFSAGFQAIYAIVALCVWSADRFFFYIDAALLLITPFVDWYWFTRYYKDGLLSHVHITLFCLLTGYYTFRLWVRVTSPKNSSWHSTHAALERLQIVWVTRSASLVSEVLPEIRATFDELVAEWGMDARKVCPISIYVTDKDQQAICSLASEMHGLPIDLYFDRPGLAEILENHTLDLITTRRMSRSLVTFCGSPQLASELHHIKITNDIIVGTTGRTKHVMDFVSESYGGIGSTKTKNVEPLHENDEDSSSDGDVSSAPPLEPQILCTRSAIEFISYDGMEESAETSATFGWEI